MRPAVLDGGRAAVIFAFTGLLLWGMWWHARVEPPPREAVTRIRYSFEVTNRHAEPVRVAEFLAFGPATLPGRQHVQRLTANAPFDLQVDDFGNQTLRFELRDLPPFGTRILVIDAEIVSFDPPLAARDELLAPFLAAEPKVEVDHPAIRARAHTLRDALGASRNSLISGIAGWVSGHVVDIGYVTEDRGAVYALQHRQGDCTEYMSLFSALARALDVPTKNLGGFRVAARGGRLSVHAYHNWSEAHDGRRWILVDPQNDVVGERYAEYVVFRVLTAATQLSNTQRFFSADARLDIKMQ